VIAYDFPSEHLTFEVLLSATPFPFDLPSAIKLVLDTLESFSVETHQRLFDHCSVLFKLDSEIFSIESAF
jgi:hypothetical protein